MVTPATSRVQNSIPSDSESVNIQAETESKTDKREETSSRETKGRNPEETDENPKLDIITEGICEKDQNPTEGKEGTFTEGIYETDQNPNEGEGGIMAEGSRETDQNLNEGEQGEEGEEEGECGFCLFMKGGGCRDQFIAWEKCVEEGEANKEDIADKCYKVTSLLRECMDLHSDYYEPLFRAERAMDEKIVAEMNEQESQGDAQVKEKESHDMRE